MTIKKHSKKPSAPKSAPDGMTMTVVSNQETEMIELPTPVQSVTEILLSDIELAHNYRKQYDQDELKEFAEAIKAVGFVISPVTLRRKENGKYELVAGYRRYFGSQLADLSAIPAIIRELTDGQVQEIQLQENIQRVDPHPVYEADAINRMYARDLTTEEIALRLGKSVTWVYKRVKLCGLIQVIQEMFLAGVFNLSQAYEVSDMSPEAQQSFSERYCTGWKERKINFNNLTGMLSYFRCDLSKAIFDIRDALLLPAEGACMNCRFNTAYSGLLIPDLESGAKCTRMTCFDQKRQAHISRTIHQAMTEDQPVAIITYGELPTDIQAVVDRIPEAKSLPLYQIEKVTLIAEPEKPSMEDYRFENMPGDYLRDILASEEDDEDSEDGQVTHGPDEIYQAGYEEAMAEYKTDSDEYQAKIADGRSLKGFYLSSSKIGIMYYYPEPAGKRLDGTKEIKSAEIKDLIKAGKDTPEILKAEIARIQTRETRFKELDREKVQNQVHAVFQTVVSTDTAAIVLTDADKLATRFLIYDALMYSGRDKVEKFLKLRHDQKDRAEALYQAMSKMTESQFAFMIRTVLSSKSESKNPKSATGLFLRRVAESAGIDTMAIEKQQELKAQKRTDNQKVKISLYKKRIKRLEKIKQAA